MESNEHAWSVESRLSGKEYWLPKHYLALGIASAVLFALMGIGSTLAALLNIDGSFLYPVPTAIFFGCAWSGFAFLGGWLILAYYRERLFVSPQLVRTTGCFRTRQVHLPAVFRAVWKSWYRGGGLVLYDPAGKVAIHFGNYLAGEQAELIPFFRETLGEQTQVGWDRFESCCVPQSAAFLQRQERERQWSYVLLPIVSAMLVALSVWDP
jgi:hypothetical protein